MRTPQHEPITVRGLTYATRKSAAKALGVSVNTVHTAIHKGRLDTLGLGPRPKAPEYLPVRIRGRTYKSVQAAARWLKVKPCTISCALARGTIDNVGLGQGKRPKKDNKIG